MSALLRLHLDADAAPTTLFAAALLACLTTPVQHSLLLHTISWAALCTTCALKTKSLLAPRSGRWIAYSAGVLLALGQVCERAVDTGNIWWTQALLPATIYAAGVAGITAGNDTIPWGGLAGLTVAGLAAGFHTTSNALTALGLSYVVLSVVTLMVLERAFTARNPIYSTNGLLTQPEPDLLTVLQDVAVAAGSVCFSTAIFWESWRFDGLTQWGLFGRVLGDSWIPGQMILSLVQALLAIGFQVVFATALASMVHKEKIFPTSFVLFAAFTSAIVLSNFSIRRLWFGSLAGLYLYVLHRDISRFRPLRILGVVLLVSLVVSAFQVSSMPVRSFDVPQPLPQGSHPMATLIGEAQEAWSKTLHSQSRTLEAAVIEYKRRYGMSPPPHFDKWYEFAVARDSKMIDEYDTIYHSLLPFWGLAPGTIRARARESIGHKGNNLLGLIIRDGKAVHVENADDWQQRATVGIIEKYVQYLPDMDLPFNIHDEPRVVVPAGGLEQLVRAGQAEIASCKATRSYSKAAELNDGRRIDEVKFTRFNSFPHQATWGPSVISCPSGSPVGSFKEAADNVTAYALGELGFIYNHTAFTDVCNTPSLRDSHGFFERANAFSVVHDLYPVFSQSKMSTFQDIVYPSVWYWYEKTAYHEIMDSAWDKKENTLYWRGSTTGGYSQDGGWRKQHRQQYVKKLNQPKGKVLVDGVVVEQEQKLDVHFSNVKQCDENDCAAQEEYFNVGAKVDQQDAWKYKYLLDMDGNAYSGRFYAFLKSHSLVFKMAVFREWHEEWIKPWVHYIPLSLKADDVLEAVRWTDNEGKAEGEQMARTSSDWAKAVLRKEDYEVWMFRLLLEYGRVVDDQRVHVGYV